MSWKDVENVCRMAKSRARLTMHDSVLRLFVDSEEVPRLVPRKRGRINVRSTSVPNFMEYIFFLILDLPWLHLIVFVAIFSVIVFGTFGSLFWITGGGFTYDNREEELSWQSCLFFTFQTFDDIGYGRLSPNTVSGDVISSITALLGNFVKIFIGGVIVHKIHDPKKLKHTNNYSKYAVWNKTTLSFQDDTWSTGVDCLSFRLTRKCTRSTLCSSSFHLLYFKTYTDMDGWERFEFQELDYEINKQQGRNRSAFFSPPLLGLPWTIIHPITKHSPLHGLTLKDMEQENGEVIGILEGSDESYKHYFQARWSYKACDIKKDREFIPCVRRREDGIFFVDFRRFSKTRMIFPMRGTRRMTSMKKIKKAIRNRYKKTTSSIKKIGGAILRREKTYTKKSKSENYYSWEYERSLSTPLPDSPPSEDRRSGSEDPKSGGYLRKMLRSLLQDVPSLAMTNTTEKRESHEHISGLSSSPSRVTEVSRFGKLNDLSDSPEQTREVALTSVGGLRRRHTRCKSEEGISKSIERKSLGTSAMSVEEYSSNKKDTFNV